MGIMKAPQYSASKHGVLGLMRALDPIVTADNIRIAAIHPWFAGKLISRTPTLFLSQRAKTKSTFAQTKRYVSPRAPSQAAARRHPADARAAYRGRHFPRSDGPGLRDERVPLGPPGRRARYPRREGGAPRGRIRYAQRSCTPG